MLIMDTTHIHEQIYLDKLLTIICIWTVLGSAAINVLGTINSASGNTVVPPPAGTVGRVGLARWDVGKSRHSNCA